MLLACGEDMSAASAVESGEWLAGGETTNTLLFGSNAFSLPASNLSEPQRMQFFTGNSFFNQNWVTAPASTTGRDGLGPLYNARGCSGCHFKDGRGAPPAGEDEAPVALLFRLSVPGESDDGGPRPEPNYGGQLQPLAIMGTVGEGRVQVRWRTIEGAYEDGTPYELRAPEYTFEDLAYGALAADVMVSARVAPAMIGLGLLEHIDEARLHALADPDDRDGDGVSGKVARVWDVARNEVTAGKFGWKASQPSLRQQNAAAFNGDIGITSTLFASETCTRVQTDCANAIGGGSPEISADLLDDVTHYTRTLAVPVRRAWDDERVLRGKALFHASGCASCHTPSHTTGSSTDYPQLSGQKIWPYTDLLLHDMGEGLSDGRPVFNASAREWRTPPLWGLGLIPDVNRHDNLLHDGRARGFAEAILWHGGEAEAARDAFVAMDQDARENLVLFLESL